MVMKSAHNQHSWCFCSSQAALLFLYISVCDLRCGRRMQSTGKKELAGIAPAASHLGGRMTLVNGCAMRLKCPIAAATADACTRRARSQVWILCMWVGLSALALSYCLVFDLWSCSSEPRAHLAIIQNCFLLSAAELHCCICAVNGMASSKCGRKKTSAPLCGSSWPFIQILSARRRQTDSQNFCRQCRRMALSCSLAHC